MKINKLQGGENNETKGEFIKGGFPRIKICDENFIKKINDRKQKQFSSKTIMKISEIMSAKTNDTTSLFDFMTDTPTVIMENNDDLKQINGISIDTIIGKKF
jgi:hypothetical protein